MAVYTHVGEAALGAFLAAYDVGAAARFEGIEEGVENSNYFVETERGRYILTLYEKRVREEDVPFFLSLMQHLSERGFPCPRPIVARSGAMQGVLEGRPAALLQFLDGVAVRHRQPEHCAAVGRVLARLHRESADFVGERTNRLGISSWRGLLHLCEEKREAWPPEAQTRAAELHRTLDALESAWPENLPRGITHADLFPDNVLFRDGEVDGVIDFYFACRETFAYDIAVCVNAWCFRAEREFAPEMFRALLEGYERERRLEAAERAALPILCRGAAMRFLLTRLHDWVNHVEGSLVSPKDPREYLAKLVCLGDMGDIRDYGVPA